MSSVQRSDQRGGERDSLYFKTMGIKANGRSFNGRKEKTMNAVHSLARFMASPSISHFREIQWQLYVSTKSHHCHAHILLCNFSRIAFLHVNKLWYINIDLHCQHKHSVHF